MFHERLDELFSCVRECSYTSATGRFTKEQAFERARKLIQTTSERGGIVYVIGNGGSAGIASHFSNDLMKALKISSQTLYDSNLLTCLANDFGYDQIFSYPLEKLLNPADLLVAISSSGKSPNIVNAASVAISKKNKLITLSGFSKDNPLRKMGALNFWINRDDYGLVETAHFFLLHTLIDCWKIAYVQVPRTELACQN